MKKQVVTIEIASGLEARPVAMLVQVASQYDSEIYIMRDNKKVNAKSIMGMMTLGLDMGDSIEVSTNGTDEEKAMEAIVEYLSAK
ncbi:HPr family phosphocarrier protein [Oscillospiraceae bacterium Marseille-Q3528]|nr:HPr family phosphocarrier protein [Oscillospiraceae bacterium Marseille-Q3528]WNV57701.1 HPr family phosphocarrier protein [Oscillospiraceae bacterium NTUH-002-81]